MTRRKNKFRLAIFLFLFMIGTCENVTSVDAAGTTGGTPATGGSPSLTRRRYVGNPVRGTNYLRVFLLYTCGLVIVLGLIQWSFTRPRD